MKRTHLPPQLQELLRSSSYVTIATVCPDGRPWNTPVVGRFDDELNFYWVSWRENQHSKNIAEEPRIFVVVYDTQAPEGTGTGLYLQMRAHVLNSSAAIKVARGTYDTSFFEHPFDDHAQFSGRCPQRIYKAVPEKIWRNTGGKVRGHFVDERRVIPN